MLRLSSTAALRSSQRRTALHRLHAADGLICSSHGACSLHTRSPAAAPVPRVERAPTMASTLAETNARMAAANQAAQALGVPLSPDPLPIPVGTKVVNSYILPPPSSSGAATLSAAEQAALRKATAEPLAKKLVRWAGEYRQSVHEKLTDPVGVWKRAYLVPLTAFYKTWRNRLLIPTRIRAKPATLQVESFGPHTNLQDFTLLNDNSFGGSSTCGLELRERLEPDPSSPTGAMRKKYSVVFKGELRMLMPFQGKKDQLTDGKRAQQLPPHRPLQNTPPEQTAGADGAASAAAPSSSSAPKPMRMSSRPPNMPSSSSSSSFPAFPSVPPPPPPPSPAAAAASSSSSPSSSSSAFPSLPTAAPGSGSASAASNDGGGSGPVNPFLRPTESSQQSYFRSQQPADEPPRPPIPSGPSFEPEPDSFSARFARMLQPAARDDRAPINGFAALILPAFAYPDLNLEFFDFLAMQVRTDGRSYIFNVRARDGIFDQAAGLVWAARIKAETPRPMHKLEVRFENLLCTEHGRPRQFGTALPKGRIESFGFSVTGPPGPFELEIEGLWAQCGTPDFERKALEAHKAAEAAEKARRLARRVADFDRRRAVAQELDKLRAARAASAAQHGGSTAAFDAAVIEDLKADNIRRMAAAAATASNDAAAASSTAAATAPAAAAASSAPPAPATPAASPASPSAPLRFGERTRAEQIAELAEEVEMEVDEETHRKTQREFGFGGTGSMGLHKTKRKEGK